MSLQRFIFLVSATYIVVLVVSLILIVTMIPRFEEVGHLEHGCYSTDALITYVECKGFPGHSFVKFIVNMPYQLIYLPVFGVTGFIHSPWLIVLAAIAWSPFVYFGWYLIKHQNKLKKSR